MAGPLKKAKEQKDITQHALIQAKEYLSSRVDELARESDGKQAKAKHFFQVL